MTAYSTSPSPASAAAARVRNSRSCPPDPLPSSPVSPCAAYASMNSYASSMVSPRRRKVERGSLESFIRSTRSCADLLRVPDGLNVRTIDGPSFRVVVLEILPAGDPAKQHRLRDPPLFGPHGEIDVGDDEANERHAADAVQDVGQTPGSIAEEIRVPFEERRADAHHHDEPAHHHGQSGNHDGEVIQAIAKRILARPW